MNLKSLIESNKTSYEVINSLIGGDKSVCVLLKLKTSRWSEITSLIQKEDIAGKGIEDEVHVTIVYGSFAGDENELRNYVENEFTSKVFDYHRKIIKTKKLDVFNNEEFDVLKFSLEGNSMESFLGLLREEILTRFNIIPSFQEYKPHITVAYLRPGSANFYVNIYKMFGSYQYFEIEGVKFSVKDVQNT